MRRCPGCIAALEQALFRCLQMSEFTTPDGTQLFYECVGNGPTVMICAGGPNATFDYLVDDLRPLHTSFRLVFHDYRGSGRSSTASETTYTFEHFADDV